MLLINLPLPPAAQAIQSDWAVYHRLDAYLEVKLQEVRNPGLAIGVVQGDEIVYLRGYGTAGAPAGPVTLRTLSPAEPNQRLYRPRRSPNDG